jgi:hypothetical protein
MPGPDQPWTLGPLRALARTGYVRSYQWARTHPRVRTCDVGSLRAPARTIPPRTTARAASLPLPTGAGTQTPGLAADPRSREGRIRTPPRRPKRARDPRGGTPRPLLLPHLRRLGASQQQARRAEGRPAGSGIALPRTAEHRRLMTPAPAPGASASATTLTSNRSSSDPSQSRGRRREQTPPSPQPRPSGQGIRCRGRNGSTVQAPPAGLPGAHPRTPRPLFGSAG